MEKKLRIEGMDEIDAAVAALEAARNVLVEELDALRRQFEEIVALNEERVAEIDATIARVREGKA